MNSLVHSREALVPVADLSALIAKLEAAEGGSRALDGDVAWIFHPKLWGRRNPANGQHQWMTEIDGKPRVLPRYTTSIDAALALAERVLLPGSGIGLCQCSPTDWEAWVGGRPAYAPRYRTGPLALCIAILKAHTSRAVEGGK